MTCLCLTRNRRHWLPQAIRQFQEQTFPARELLIVADGEGVLDLIPDDRRIRLIHLQGRHDIGTKRNFGCSRALGNIIAHWDDDDFSAAPRLEDQVARLQLSGKAVTGYRRMRFTDGVKWWQYTGAPNYVVGTSLCYRRDWWQDHPFPAKSVGEDGDFVMMAAQAGALDVAPDAGPLMHATIHDGNTSPRLLGGDNWKSCD